MTGRNSLAALVPPAILLGLWGSVAIAGTSPAFEREVGVMAATYLLTPEPSSISLFVAGIFAVLWLNRRRRSRIVV